MLKTITAKITEVAAVAVRAVCAFIADNARPLLRGFARASVLVVMTAAVAGCGGKPLTPRNANNPDCPWGSTYSVSDYTGGSHHYHTPLFDAALEGNLYRVKFLVEKCGASINQAGASDEDQETLIDNHGTPLDAALRSGRYDVAEFLKSKGGKCKVLRNC